MITFEECRKEIEVENKNLFCELAGGTRGKQEINFAIHYFAGSGRCDGLLKQLEFQNKFDKYIYKGISRPLGGV